MKNLSSVHCHSSYVDGKSTSEEVILSAIEKGFVSIGFSDHGPQDFDPRCSMAKDKIPLYINEILSLREKYADRIRIHLGIEMDAFSTADPAMFEYVLGAAHYFNEGPDFCGVDQSGDKVIEYRDSVYNGDGTALAQRYYSIVGDFAERVHPHVFAHFDLIKKNNQHEELYDSTCPKVIEAQFDALDKVFKAGCILEVNTGGMARSNQPRPYPDPHILKRWHDMGGRVILGSDCHFAPTVDYAYPEAIEYMKAAGFKTAWRLGAYGEDQFVEYKL